MINKLPETVYLYILIVGWGTPELDNNLTLVDIDGKTVLYRERDNNRDG